MGGELSAGQGSPGSMYTSQRLGEVSTSTRILADRQTAADARATRTEERFAIFAREMQRSTASTTELLAQMRQDQRAAEQRALDLAARLASEALTATAANAAQREMMRTRMYQDRQSNRNADAEALDSRLAPLIAAAIERHTTAPPQAHTSEHAELRSSLTALSERADARELATTSAMERMTEVIQSLQASQQSSGAHNAATYPANELPLPDPIQHAAQSSAASNQPRDVEAVPPTQPTYNTWNGRAPYERNGVGRSVGQTPAVLGPQGGPGAGGYGQPSRNPWAEQPISDSDRARHRQGDEQQAREMAAAQQRNNVEIEAHRNSQNAARDRRTGLALVPGQGSWPAPHTAPHLQEPTSMIGAGS